MQWLKKMHRAPYHTSFSVTLLGAKLLPTILVVATDWATGTLHYGYSSFFSFSNLSIYTQHVYI